MRKCKKNDEGFTLIELSIVVVIIGLIVGAVLVGKDLIRAAELRKVPQELSQIETAINVFKLKYDCLPGDCDSISQFFPSATDGNGNGVINGDNPGSHGIAENDHMWNHLGLAGLTQEFTVVSSGTAPRIGGINIYPTGAGKGGYLFRDGTINTLYGRDGRKIQLGGDSTNYPNGPLFTTTEAMAIDQKMDDGLASDGWIYATNGAGSSACTDKGYTASPPSVYLAASDEISCRLFFWQK